MKAWIYSDPVFKDNLSINDVPALPAFKSENQRYSWRITRLTGLVNVFSLLSANWNNILLT